MTATPSKLRKPGHVTLSANQEPSPTEMCFLMALRKRGGGLKRGTTGLMFGGAVQKVAAWRVFYG